MIKIASFDILDQFELQQKMFTFPDTGSWSPEAEQAGYDSLYFTLNIGTLFFIILLIGLLLLVLGILYTFRKIFKSLTKIRKKLHRKIFWNGIIRFLIEAYFEIILVIGIQVTSLDKSVGVFVTSGVVVSLIFGATLSIVSLILPFFIMVYYPRKVDLWMSKEFKRKYGTVLFGLDRNPDPKLKNYNRLWALLFQMILLVRRLIFVIAVIGAPDFLVMHLQLLFASSIISIIYLVGLWPFEKPRDTKMQVFNEVCSVFLLYHLMCFSAFVPDPMIRYNLGYTYVFVAAINLSFYLVLMIRQNFKSMKKKLRKKLAKYR